MMADDFKRAQLIFLDEIAKQNATAADLLRSSPESLRQIIEAAVVALRESVVAGTLSVSEAIRSIPKPEPVQPVLEAVAGLSNTVVIAGNRQQGAIAAVVEAVKAIPVPTVPAAQVREWEVIPDRDRDTGFIRSVKIKAIV